MATQAFSRGIAALALVAAAGGAGAQMNPIAGNPIATQAGRIAGTRLASGVRAYLGIPYAKPPVRELRWRAPEPFAWGGVYNADRTGAECIQVLRPHKINHYFGEEPTSENCLYLNIWTPADATPGAKLPVIVFLHGGGGTVGSSGQAIYGGEAVARHGAVFVNLNYRVGLLGFMAHPALSAEQGGHSGNYGYLDQTAALRWIRDNIAAFGGDPDKVLLTGQSAGAGSVAAQIMSPLAKGLFRAGAMWSGCNFDAPAVPLAESETIGADVQRRLGAADLEAMRDVPADRILALQEEHQLGANVSGVRIPPTIDGYFWTMQKPAMLVSGGASDVPIIASGNGDDLDSNRSPLVGARTVADYRAIAGRMYGADAAAFLNLYPAKSDAEVAPMAHKAAWEGGFLRQSQTCGALKARYTRTPTYVDVFLRRHPYVPGVRIADQDLTTIGAYHTADVPYWFGTFDAFNLFRPTRAWTAADMALSDEMMGLLIAFADTGVPTTARFAWPAWTPQRQNYATFEDRPLADVMAVKRMDWLAAHKPRPLDAQPRRSNMTRD